MVSTGLAVQLGHDEVLKLYDRSSNPVKRGIALINSVGIIDSDYYPNEFKGLFMNISKEPVTIAKGQRIMQGVFVKQTRCYGCDKPIEPEWLPVGEFIVCDECSSDTDELSVEKLQEQLNSKVKALTEIRANIEEHNQIYDLSTDTALLLEGIDGIAFEALETEEGNE